ncbi:MAG: alkaline phosphatase D family protein [Planctomycetales bacterium]
MAEIRSPNDIPDGPEKTIWGSEQKAWLQRTLLESDATWKILISPHRRPGPRPEKRQPRQHRLARRRRNPRPGSRSMYRTTSS